jgi:hypothetical protein
MLKIFLIGLLGICTSSENCVFSSLAHLYIPVFVLLVYNFWALCRFWILILYLLNSCSKIVSKSMGCLMNLVIFSCDTQKFCVLIYSSPFCQFLFLLTVKLESCSENNCLYLHVPVHFLASSCLRASDVAQLLGCLLSKPEDLCLIPTPIQPWPILKYFHLFQLIIRY